jgi:hypothetical protein
MGRLTPLAIAVAVACAAAPAAADPGTARRAPGVPLLPLEHAASLSPIPGQECTEENHGLCTQCSEPAARPPEPVIIDCRDPSVAWVQEMVGECDMPPHAGGPAEIGPPRERPHEPACLDAESCRAPRQPVAADSTSIDSPPVAIAAGVAFDTFAAGSRLRAAVALRRDLGHPLRLLRPPNPLA